MALPNIFSTRPSGYTLKDEKRYLPSETIYNSINKEINKSRIDYWKVYKDWREAIGKPDALYYFTNREGEGRKLLNPNARVLRPEAYWEEPQRLIQINKLIQYAPPNWQPPDWMDVESITDAYRYLEYRNRGKPYDQWQRIREDDPGYSLYQKIPRPPDELLHPEEQDKEWQYYHNMMLLEKDYQARMEQYNQEKLLSTQEDYQRQLKEELENDLTVRFEDLPVWQQVILATNNKIPTQDLAEVPVGITATQSLSSAIQAGFGARGMVAGLGSIIGGVAGLALGTALTPVIAPWIAAAGVIAGIGIGIYTGVKAFQGESIAPWLQNIYAGFNKGAEAVERGFGLSALMFNGVNVFDLTKEERQIANLAYDVGVIPINNVIANTISWLSSPFGFMESDGQIARLSAGEVWAFEQGYVTPRIAYEGMMGGEALAHALLRLQAGESYDDIYWDIVQRFGYSGNIGDFISQSILDPLNVIDYATDTLGIQISKKLKADTVAKAFDTVRGNLLADVLPLGWQQAATGLARWINPETGFKTSGGIFDAYQTYKLFLTSGYNIKRTNPSFDPLRDYNNVQRWMIGMDDTGKIKQYLPNIPNLKLSKAARITNYLTSITSESRAFTIAEILQTNLDHIEKIANDADEIFKMVEMIGNSRIDVNNAATYFLDTPLTRTANEAVYQFINDGVTRTEHTIFMANQSNRKLLDIWAKKLKIEPDELVDYMYTGDWQDMFDLMHNTSGQDKLYFDTLLANYTQQDFVNKFWDIYHHLTPVTELEYIVRFKDRMNRNINNYIAKRYNLGKDHWVIRATKLLKTAQSLALLNLNPRWAILNGFNNLASRALNGQFGFISNKIMNDIIARYELVLPDRFGEGFNEKEGSSIYVKGIKSDDILSRMTSKFSQFNRKVGIFGNLSSWLENTEGKQAVMIGILQYLKANWKSGKGFQPIPPNILGIISQLGYTPGQFQNMIAAMNSKAALQSLLIKPEDPVPADIAQIIARNIQLTNMVDSVLDELYPGEDRSVADQMLAYTHLTGQLDAALESFEGDMDSAVHWLKNKLEDTIRERQLSDMEQIPLETAQQVWQEGSKAIPKILHKHWADDISEKLELELFRDTYMNDYWFEMRINTDISKRRARQIIEQGQTEYKHRIDQQYRKQIARMKGMLDALMVNNAQSNELLNNMLEKQMVYTRTYETQNNLQADYYKKSERTPSARAKLDKLLTELWDASYLKIDEIDSKQIELYKIVFGSTEAQKIVLDEMLKKQIDFRKTLEKKEQQIYKRLEGETNNAKRHKAYQDFQREEILPLLTKYRDEVNADCEELPKDNLFNHDIVSSMLINEEPINNEYNRIIIDAEYLRTYTELELKAYDKYVNEFMEQAITELFLKKEKPDMQKKMSQAIIIMYKQRALALYKRTGINPLEIWGRELFGFGYLGEEDVKYVLKTMGEYLNKDIDDKYIPDADEYTDFDDYDYEADEIRLDNINELDELNKQIAEFKKELAKYPEKDAKKRIIEKNITIRKFIQKNLSKLTYERALITKDYINNQKRIRTQAELEEHKKITEEYEKIKPKPIEPEIITEPEIKIEEEFPKYIPTIIDALKIGDRIVEASISIDKYLGQMKGEGVTVESVYDGIKSGEVTALTIFKNKNNKYKMLHEANRKGNIITINNPDGHYLYCIVTKRISRLDENTDATTWSKKNGYNEEYFYTHIKPEIDKDNAYQIEFKYVKYEGYIKKENLKGNGEPIKLANAIVRYPKEAPEIEIELPTGLPANIKYIATDKTNYAIRTKVNAGADMTLQIANTFRSAGEKLTTKLVKAQDKILQPVYLPDDLSMPDAITLDIIVARINSGKIKTLNIAGNSIQTIGNKFTQAQLDDYVFKLMTSILEHPRLRIKDFEVWSGGQTGIDEAGTKAAVRLGLKATIHATKNWKIVNKSGYTIISEDLFKKRFNIMERPKDIIEPTPIPPTPEPVPQPTTLQEIASHPKFEEDLYQKTKQPLANMIMLEDGRALIRASEAADFASCVHELIHVWARNLDDNVLQVLISAAMPGMTVEKYRDIEYRVTYKVQKGDPEKRKEERNIYRRIDEAIAYGAMRYMINKDRDFGTLEPIMRDLQTWLIELYKNTGRGTELTFTKEVADAFELLITNEKQILDQSKTPNSIKMRSPQYDVISVNKINPDNYLEGTREEIIRYIKRITNIPYEMKLSWEDNPDIIIIDSNNKILLGRDIIIKIRKEFNKYETLENKAAIPVEFEGLDEAETENAFYENIYLEDIDKEIIDLNTSTKIKRYDTDMEWTFRKEISIYTEDMKRKFKDEWLAMGIPRERVEQMLEQNYIPVYRLPEIQEEIQNIPAKQNKPYYRIPHDSKYISRVYSYKQTELDRYSKAVAKAIEKNPSTQYKSIREILHVGVWDDCKQWREELERLDDLRYVSFESKKITAEENARFIEQIDDMKTILAGHVKSLIQLFVWDGKPNKLLKQKRIEITGFTDMELDTYGYQKIPYNTGIKIDSEWLQNELRTQLNINTTIESHPENVRMTGLRIITNNKLDTENIKLSAFDSRQLDFIDEIRASDNTEQLLSGISEFAFKVDDRNNFLKELMNTGLKEFDDAGKSFYQIFQETKLWRSLQKRMDDWMKNRIEFGISSDEANASMPLIISKYFNNYMDYVNPKVISSQDFLDRYPGQAPLEQLMNAVESLADDAIGNHLRLDDLDEMKKNLAIAICLYLNDVSVDFRRETDSYFELFKPVTEETESTLSAYEARAKKISIGMNKATQKKKLERQEYQKKEREAKTIRYRSEDDYLAYEMAENEINEHGDTPLPPSHEPLNGGITQEVYQKFIIPILNLIQQGWSKNVQQYLNTLSQGTIPANTNKAFWKSWHGKIQPNLAAIQNLTPAQIASYNAYINNVINSFDDEKRMAVRYGMMMRDNAMLNYNDRTGMDEIFDFLFPYQFWFTRNIGEWAKRVINRPNILSYYYRRNRMLERNGEYLEDDEENIPKRIIGKMKIPWVFKESWMGDSIYVNPWGDFMPIENLTQPLNLLDMAAESLNPALELDALEAAGQITSLEKEVALTTKSGDIYEMAYQMAADKVSQDMGDPMTILSMMISPNIFLKTISKAMEKAITGEGDVLPSNLPVMKTAMSFVAIADKIGLIDGGRLVPKKGKTKNEIAWYGQWGDWLIDRMLTNMATEKQYYWKDVYNAMINHEGTIYQEAVRRLTQEVSLKMPGTLLADKIADGDLSDIPFAIAFTLMPASIFPEGEMEIMGLKNELKLAWNARANGYSQPLTDFFDNHPEYLVRASLNDEPEMRYKKFMVSEIMTAYSKLSSYNKVIAKQALGLSFIDNILASDSVNYDKLNAEQLTHWAKLMNGYIPDAPEEISADIDPDTLRNLPEIQYFSDEEIATIEKYYADRDRLYPDHTWMNNNYWSFETKEEQKAYLKRFPVLERYWNWNKQYKLKNPVINEWLEIIGTKIPESTKESEPRLYYGISADLIDEIKQQKNELFPDYNWKQIIYFNLPEPVVNPYYAARDKLFPNFSQLNNAYWDLETKEERKAFLASNPDLKLAWEWGKQYKQEHPFIPQVNQRKAFLANNPDLVAAWEWDKEQEANIPEYAKYKILADEEFQKKAAMPENLETAKIQGNYYVISNLHEFVRLELTMYKMTGQELSEGAKNEIDYYWIIMGKPTDTLEEYIDKLINY